MASGGPLLPPPLPLPTPLSFVCAPYASYYFDASALDTVPFLCFIIPPTVLGFSIILEQRANTRRGYVGANEVLMSIML